MSEISILTEGLLAVRRLSSSVPLTDAERSMVGTWDCLLCRVLLVFAEETVYFFVRLLYWLAGWLAGWLSEWLAEWLNDFDRNSLSLTDRLSVRVSVYLSVKLFSH